MRAVPSCDDRSMDFDPSRRTFTISTYFRFIFRTPSRAATFVGIVGGVVRISEFRGAVNPQFRSAQPQKDHSDRKKASRTRSATARTDFTKAVVTTPRARVQRRRGASSGWRMQEVSRVSTPRDCAEYYRIRHRGPTVP